MTKIRFTCETYAWIMCGDKFIGKIDHLADTASAAGFQGIEPMNLQLGSYRDPLKLRDALEARGVSLSSVALVCDWLNPVETESERREADQMMDLIKAFPHDVLLMPVQMPQKDRENLEVRQENFVSCVNALARRAAERGIVASYHPNSPAGSVWRTREDYDKLLPRLDSEALGWTPDVGHIAKGGMDPVALIREYRDLVNHIHFKDMFADGTWAQTGEGDIDFKTVIEDLVRTGFDGWVVFEDECDAAVGDPDGVTLKDGTYIRDVVKPWIPAAALAS
jgi:inosose dehydratase